MKASFLTLRTITLIVILDLISITAHPQKGNFEANEIQGKAWHLQGMTDKMEEDIYDNNKLISTISDSSKQKIVIKFEYYLSNFIETSFDSTKVGSNTDGKSIIKRALKVFKGNPSQQRPVSIYEIVELTSTKFALRNIKQTNLLEFLSK